MTPTVRERYRARQQRIAAGVPVPPPVTVTDAFFADLQVAPETRTCSECDATFTPRNSLNIACSRACARARDTRLRREERRARAATVHICKICEQPFISTDPRIVTCSVECRQERRRETKRGWYERQEAPDHLAAMMASSAERKREAAA